MREKVSKITQVERDRRALLAASDTPQSLAGLLYVAECMAHGTAATDWRTANGKVLDIPERYGEIKATILEMQRKECTDEPLESSRDPGL